MRISVGQEEKKKIMSELNQESVKNMKELSVEELDRVVGAGDPYAAGTGNPGNGQGSGGTTGNDGSIILPELP